MSTTKTCPVFVLKKCEGGAPTAWINHSNPRGVRRGKSGRTFSHPPSLKTSRTCSSAKPALGFSQPPSIYLTTQRSPDYVGEGRPVRRPRSRAGVPPLPSTKAGAGGGPHPHRSFPGPLPFSSPAVFVTLRAILACPLSPT